tara:strand:+ start:111 stop:248 length:138 start_codon:yes stop_codon:yes gene_type:complete
MQFIHCNQSQSLLRLLLPHAAAHGLCALLGLRAQLTLASGLQLWC